MNELNWILLSYSLTSTPTHVPSIVHVMGREGEIETDRERVCMEHIIHVCARAPSRQGLCLSRYKVLLEWMTSMIFWHLINTFNEVTIACTCEWTQTTSEKHPRWWLPLMVTTCLQYLHLFSIWLVWIISLKPVLNCANC